ncbi:phosphate/phosphite/phosphonate ABC transporter substrate-binding protein [Martelella mediterranea]|mgnify:CR=1 FL=1|uniref:Phosphate/phosphite/phosphonate ABC transporter, periplasmic binding protein n=1 Tax=Martelella mediterranea DSM 17316 TaxID=1122214 RepID=A0A1U9Z865_9HYPH|nr:PhnD/SsuA/transferrin family substrate-binding protein [Martelella mediterranea]AQZ53874.1 phosphate/phosphite/phosphonate ABC transporter, periplasmic binding protein [Martelella mediterranea DSM 17316]
MGLIANTRMYNLTPPIRALFGALVMAVSEASGVVLDVIAHEAPRPLGDLWSRNDMGMVFMCSYPYAQRLPSARPQPLAAPVSTAEWAAGQPVYASRIVVRDESITHVEQLKAARWAWTVRDSQSGYNAPREFLAGLGVDGAVETVGPVITPAGVIDAVRDGKADAGAVDAYAWQLLEMHAPEMIKDLAVAATTAPAPFPMLVASASAPKEGIDKLRTALLALHETESGRTALAPLGLARFAMPDLAAVEALPGRARETDARLGARW